MSPQRRLPTGESDSLSFTCICTASSSPTGGTILLFYRYFSSNPTLPSQYQDLANIPSTLATFHQNLVTSLSLNGKLRIAKEGFNITIGGTKGNIDSYINALLPHWSLAGLNLSTPELQKQFFKPSSGGCACSFGPLPASITIKDEITPLGITNYSPKDWEIVKYLSPREFHELCCEEVGEGERVLMDVRNYYESRIGYFVDPGSGRAAVRPGIRRFSQWPGFVRRYLEGKDERVHWESGGRKGFECFEGTKGSGGLGGIDGLAGQDGQICQNGTLDPLDSDFSTKSPKRHILTYCTGGIRCEKGVRWMAENLPGDPALQQNTTIYTLHGGISAYLMWMDEEIKLGRKSASDSLFKGRNYVFDYRGSIGLEEGESEIVSKCHVCATPTSQLSKCSTSTCHLILVLCESCSKTSEPACCQSCFDHSNLLVNSQDEQAEHGKEKSKKTKFICDCEKEREDLLWGGGQQVKLSKGGRKSARRKKNVDIRIKTF